MVCSFLIKCCQKQVMNKKMQPLLSIYHHHYVSKLFSSERLVYGPLKVIPTNEKHLITCNIVLKYQEVGSNLMLC